jgi:molybdenum cofactor cytidylyltransferase
MPAYVEGVLLAAGESRRMGFPKPLLPINGKTYIAHLCDVLLAELPQLLVVIGAHAERVRPAIPRSPQLTVIENPNYALGQLSSLKAAIAAVDPRAQAILVHLSDQPLIRPTTIAVLLKTYASTNKPIIVACYQGKRGHPVIFRRSVFGELLHAPDAQGARIVVAKSAQRVACVQIDDPGITTDLDSPDDLIRAGLNKPPFAPTQTNSKHQSN